MTADTESAALTLGDFEGLVGTIFAIEAGAGPYPLELLSVRALPHSPRAEGGFRLEFAGPEQTQIFQSIYPFPLRDTLYDVFLVPNGPGPDRRPRYEAVFF